MSENLHFGQKLRQLREAAGISLRELAREANISAPFLSDVELGRRFPKDETLLIIAKRLRIKIETLKEHDTRSTIADLKRIAEANPSLAFAFRSMVDQVKDGKLTPSDLAAQLRKLYESKEK